MGTGGVGDLLHKLGGESADMPGSGVGIPFKGHRGAFFGDPSYAAQKEYERRPFGWMSLLAKKAGGAKSNWFNKPGRNTTGGLER